MATVNNTAEFRTRVISRIRSMKNSEINAEAPNLNKTHFIDASYLYNYGCWGKDHVHLLNQIPKDWLAQSKDVHIELTDTIDAEVKSNCSVRFSGLTNGYQRPKDSYYAHSRSVIEYRDLLAMDDALDGKDILMAAWEENKVVQAVHAKWDQIEKDILNFFSKCKTVNEAVKLYPGVRLYIHPEDIERLDRKVERMSVRKKIVEDMATDEITAAAIAAKLMGAV